MNIKILGLTITSDPVVNVAVISEIVPDLGSKLDQAEARGTQLVSTANNQLARANALLAKSGANRTSGNRKLNAAKAIRDAMGTIPTDSPSGS